MPEAFVRRRYFTAMREAVVELWGESGLAEVGGALPDEVRRLTVESPIVPEAWVPATAAMAWFDAVWTTRAERQTRLFSAFTDREVEHGFGRVRRFLLSYATPGLILTRAGGLWSDDNRGGELVVVSSAENRATLELRDHIYATTQLSRFAITDLLRAILCRCRATNVTSRGALSDDGALRMHFGWTRSA